MLLRAWEKKQRKARAGAYTKGKDACYNMSRAAHNIAI